MKFYYCEGCGERITEKDIASGEGRDKKLRGVYCRKCAEGVMTMDSMPMSDEQARLLLLKEKGKEEARPSAAGAKKFYFCETCGKRLNEDDLEAGKARDKKLKGVYCQGCAVGVTTMEYEGMTREEAERIVSKARTRPGRSNGTQIDPVAAARRKERRGSSRLRLKRAQSDRADGRAAQPTVSTGSTVMWVGAGIAIAALVAASLLFLFIGSGWLGTTAKRAKNDRKAVASSEEAGDQDAFVAEDPSGTEGEADSAPGGAASTEQSPEPKDNASETSTAVTPSPVQKFEAVKDVGDPKPKTENSKPLVTDQSKIALPPGVPGDTTVYWGGKKRVHRIGCRRLTTDPAVLAKMTKMTLAEAMAKGIPLCSRCPGSTTGGKGNPGGRGR